MEDYKKKYEHALDNFKRIKDVNKDNKELVAFIEYEYPELKESEDERIRKEILEYFQQFESEELRSVKISDWISWIEKQGERKQNVTDIISDLENYFATTTKEQQEKDWEEIKKWEEKHFNHNKHIEQNPTDKAEPKFKVGDYIERKDGLGCHARIIFVGGNVYGCEKLIYSEDSSPFFEFMFKNQDEFQISSDFKQKPAWIEKQSERKQNVTDIISDLENYFATTTKEQQEKDWKEIKKWEEKHFNHNKHIEQNPTDKDELKWKKGTDGEFLYETSVVWTHNETKTLATAGLRLDSNTFYIPISELEKLPKEEIEENLLIKENKI